MKPTGVQRKTEPNLGFWVAAGVIAVTAHAFWLWGMDWRPPAATAEQPLAARWHLQFWDEAQLSPALQDQLAVAPPTLFAMPGPVGFSQAWLVDEIAVRPPVDQPPAITLQLARSRDTADRRVVPLPERGHWMADSMQAPLPLPRPSPWGDGRQDWPDLVPRLIELRGAEGRAAESLEWPVGADEWGTEGWQAAGMLTVDRAGSVTHVVLDQRPAEQEVVARLLRTLYGWRWRPAPDVTVLQFAASYPGAPRTPLAEETE